MLAAKNYTPNTVDGNYNFQSISCPIPSIGVPVRWRISKIYPLLLFMNLIPRLTTGAEIAPSPQAQGNCLVYIGTRPGGKSKGIYLCHLDPATGTLTSPEVAAETTDPGFLAIHPNHRFLYSVRESAGFDSTPNGAVSAFAIDKTRAGKLTLVNQQTSGRPRTVSSLAIDRSGQCLLVAHYGAGQHRLAPHRHGWFSRRSCHSNQAPRFRGKADPKRQQAPHAHSVGFDLINHHALCADLGADKIFVYQFDSTTASLTTNNPSAASLAPGSGPRHFVFHPDGHHLYVINELNSTITAFDYEESGGGLKETQTISTLPDKFTGPNTAPRSPSIPVASFSTAQTADTTASWYMPSTKASVNSRSSNTNPLKGKLPETLGSIRPAISCWPPTRIPTASLSSASTQRPAACRRRARYLKFRLLSASFSLPPS